MAILTQSCLENLKHKIDLVDLLGSYVELKRAGGYYKACCPFHQEKTPSFVVQSGATHYHCFGCGAHGDAIAFLMHHLQLSFTEAVETLAERYQVPLEYESGNELGYNKTRLLEVLGLAHHYYHTNLLEEGSEALAYLKKRDIDEEFIKKFEIGLSPKSGDDLIRYLREQKVTDDELKETGLLAESGHAFFFDRIMFPIRDPRGSVIAFSARYYKEGAKGGKYINSKETPLFKKSHVFFGMNYSRMRLAKGKKALIVEGQIDALRLIHLGLNATVAPLGTALTESHVDKLVQLGIEEAYLAFDSDAAGVNAAIKTGNLLQKKGISTSVVLMPEGSDPDTHLREHGVEGFRALLKKRRDYLSFLIEVSSMRTNLNDPANKARIIEKIAEEIKKWEHPVMVHESLKKLAELTHIPESTLGIEGLARPHILSGPHGRSKDALFSPEQLLEADVLAWLLQSDLESKSALHIAKNNLSFEHFNDPQCQEIYKEMLLSLDQESPLDTISLMMKLESEESRNLLTKLLEKKVHKEQFDQLFSEAIQRLLDRAWMKRREEIKVKIQSGTLSDADAIELAKTFDEIQKNRPKVIT